MSIRNRLARLEEQVPAKEPTPRAFAEYSDEQIEAGLEALRKVGRHDHFFEDIDENDEVAVNEFFATLHYFRAGCEGVEPVCARSLEELSKYIVWRRNRESAKQGAEA